MYVAGAIGGARLGETVVPEADGVAENSRFGLSLALFSSLPLGSPAIGVGALYVEVGTRDGLCRVRRGGIGGRPTSRECRGRYRPLDQRKSLTIFTNKQDKKKLT